MTVVRIIALLVGGVELVGDEAHYWEWARHLDLSYYSKGPGVAWLIAGTTALFGDTEFGVRIGAVMSSAVTMLALGWLGRRIGGGRVGLYAVLGWMAMAVFHGTAMLMTIDGPFVMWWVIGLCAAWCGVERMGAGKSAGGAMVALGAAIGIGFLFKYTILFLPLSLIVFAVVRRKRLVWTGGTVIGALVGVVVFAVCISPVLIWNQQNGWPTVKHLLGHLGMAGGDLSHKDAGGGWSYRPVWALEFIGSQIGLVGPMVVLMGIAGVRGLRRGADTTASLLAWSGAVIVVVYFLVSFLTDVEGNWAIAGYAGLSLQVARGMPGAIDAWREKVSRWRADGATDRAGILRRKPETWAQLGWHWSLGYGVVGWLGMLMIGGVARTPVIGQFVPMHRLSGSAALAGEVSGLVAGMGGGAVLAERYDTASLLAFYMEGHPVVGCASALLGDRRTAYDYFDGTRLGGMLDESGGKAVLVGGGERKWRRSLKIGTLRTVNEDVPIHVVGGTRAAHEGAGR